MVHNPPAMRELIRYIVIPAVVGGAIGLAVIFLSGGSPAVRSGYADAVGTAVPSVVNIYSSKAVRPPICQQPRFREWCNRFTGASRGKMQSSLGSGVIVHQDGYILTNNHVITGAEKILVAFSDGKSSTAQLVGSDPETDLAVIRVNIGNLTPIQMNTSDDIRVGDVALAIGNPFGIGQTVSAGIVSAKGRAGISSNPYDDFIQTDAAINPGNSGGALIDDQGRLIGINTLIFTQSGGSAGIGFAIPTRLAVSIRDEIIETGKVTRGWLGVVLTNAPEKGSGVGLAVTDVDYDGPAGVAGLRMGDLILSIDQQPAVNSTAVSRQIAHVTPGAPIEIGVLRNGRQISFTAIAGERPQLTR